MANFWYLHDKDFFVGIEEHKKTFLQKATQRHFKKNEIIFSEGERGDFCCYVASGLVRIFRSTPSGKESIFFLRYAGEFFGLSEVISAYPRMASAQALSTTEIYTLSAPDFDALLASHYPIARKVITVLGGRVRHLGHSVSNLTACDVEERLIKVLITLVHDDLGDDASWGRPVTVPIKISQEQLALMAGTTQPTVSELLQKLQKEGYVRIDKRQITIVNPLNILIKSEKRLDF